jgi:hypothetical protein
VPGNIAQGQARYSLVEIETELLIAKDLGYIAANDAEFVLKLAPETRHIIPSVECASHPRPSPCNPCLPDAMCRVRGHWLPNPLRAVDPSEWFRRG